MKNPTDAEVYKKFCEHVNDLLQRGLKGDLDAVRSMACMALLAEGWKPILPDDPGGDEVIVDLAQWRDRLAA